MELDELKNTWTSLDERLQKQETLKEVIIKEMLQSKSGKALSKLINYTYFGIIVGLLAIIPLAYKLTLTYFGVFKTTLFVGAIVFLALFVVIGIFNVIHLHKIDITKSVCQNINLVQTYKIRVKKQVISSYVFVVLFITLAIIACIISPNMELWRWIFIGIFVVIGIVGAYWEYKRMYKANTDAILESLDKLKELEEDI